MRDVQLNNETCRNGSVVRLWCGSQSAVCLFTGDQPQIYTHLDNSTHTTEFQTNQTYNLWLGLSLALLSSILIGGSVILKKKALLRLARNGHTRAGDGGHGYLKDWLWWGGLLTMGAGEACNFAAYMFAPATLVTPLGALSVLISAVLSSYLLGEVLNVVGKLGCFLSVLGSILLVIHAPQEQEVTSLQDMTNKLLEPGFLVYMSVVLVLCAILVLYFSPRFGRTNILIYISICSLLGAFTVSSVKGLAIAINSVFNDISVLASPLTWILLFTLIVSIVTQVNYLNKSLDTFNTLLVYPIYYVLFTSVVLSTSIILFQEWRSMAVVDVVTTLGAFLVIVVGVAMLHLFKELQVTMRELTSHLSQPVEREGLAEEISGSPRAEGDGGEGRRKNRKEDKYGLMDNMVIESLPPMREEGPRVFIIS
ncbi:magnesium transporter NIPA4 isoform X2 [Dicentrarchus labrax]|uniref:magnesium transporter NIPA4 isoform X1 n=1 Tax=Dicentrarchus labrax TaxID=13489 RepID=UPI0021F58176|nr:magnesium transporter NIPA4 isoform X1 [Dicentrarchus labrax]XP_051256800.1 magnesium transporter NIPA4 isoform X2 [Dicentrarchus labrax]